MLEHLFAGRQHLFAQQHQRFLLEQIAHFNNAMTSFFMDTRREVAAVLPALLTLMQTPRRPRTVPLSEALPHIRLSRGSWRGPSPSAGPYSLGPLGACGQFSNLSEVQLNSVPLTPFGL